MGQDENLYFVLDDVYSILSEFTLIFHCHRQYFKNKLIIRLTHSFYHIIELQLIFKCPKTLKRISQIK